MNFKVTRCFKFYRNNQVVTNFNYEFHEGLYLVTGTNGIGKSTLLKCLANVISPSNDDCKMTSIKKAYLCEKIVISNGKPKAFLSHVMRLNKTWYDIDKMLMEWHIENKVMRKLSKGNKQKIGILAMLLSDSEIYFFDEPTDALDKQSVNLFISAIKELIKEKIVVVATHEIAYFEGLDYVQINMD